jgi:GR25 family glycosyltransferase involved in LPS biosynthesis
MKLNIDSVYVVHYTKLLDRKNKIVEQFGGIVDNLHFINEFDQEELSDDILKEYYLPDPMKWVNKVSPLWDVRIHRPRYLNIAEISCTIKHIIALEQVAKNGDGFIIEDDLLIKDNFLEEFNETMSNLPADWDVIMIGAGCQMHTKELIPGVKLYKREHPATRCLDSYLISQKTARKIIETVKPFQLISDWEFAFQFFLHNLNVYWLEPSPCYQGSEVGYYKSTLR